MRPRRPVTYKEAEDCVGVGDQKFMLGTELQEEEAIVVAVSGAILPNDVLPSLVVGAYTGFEVPEYEQLFRLRDGGCEVVKILVEFVFDAIRVGHRWCIGADDSCLLAS